MRICVASNNVRGNEYKGETKQFGTESSFAIYNELTYHWHIFKWAAKAYWMEQKLIVNRIWKNHLEICLWLRRRHFVTTFGGSTFLHKSVISLVNWPGRIILTLLRLYRNLLQKQLRWYISKLPFTVIH